MPQNAGSFPGQPAGGGPELPPARLLHLHRHSLTNVLVVGGSAERRIQVARAFHQESPLRAGAFVRVDCSTEEDLLGAALREWTGDARSADEPVANPFRAAERGTLYLDPVGELSAETQQLLLTMARRLHGEPVGGDAVPCAGRLVTGNPSGLSEAVSAGRFMAALYEALDKVRVELESPAPGTKT